MERSKSINLECRSSLNLLLLRQTYLLGKIQSNTNIQWGRYLATVQSQIQDWYIQTAEKIKHQARVKEFQEAEQTRIYHHEIHQNRIKRTSILRLQTEDGLLHGHEECTKYLEKMVGNLLQTPPNLHLAKIFS